MTPTLATLALVLSLGQHAEPAPPAVEHHDQAAAVEHAAPAPEAGASGEGHGEAAGHGGAKHDETLGGVMMHHVSDGYVMEGPGK
jgi:F-type H+-transporting ATPase subunit a